MSGRSKAIFEKWHRNRPNVAVSVPMTWALHREAVVSLIHAMRYLKAGDESLLTNETSVVSEARNFAIHRFLALPKSVKWLFFFDDDMVIPTNVVDVLTFRADVSDSAFLSGVCTTKSEPFMPTAYISSQGDAGAHNALAELVGTVETQYHAITDVVPNQGIRPVDGVGAACLCLRRDMLEAIEPPWFKFEGSGEDLYFCRKAIAAGFEIRIDTSVIVGHVGTRAVGLNEWAHTKDDWLAANGGEKSFAELKRA